MKKLTWYQSYFKHGCARWWFRLTTTSQCAWCQRIMRRAPLQFLFRRRLTHGICHECCTNLTYLELGGIPENDEPIEIGGGPE